MPLNHRNRHFHPQHRPCLNLQSRPCHRPLPPQSHRRTPKACEKVRTLMVQALTQYIYDLGKSRECFTPNAWHTHGKAMS
jgi:hypothetical protein